MTRWEYMTVSAFDGPLDDKLNEHGQEGWELVGIVYLPSKEAHRLAAVSTASPDHTEYVFKREFVQQMSVEDSNRFIDAMGEVVKPTTVKD